VLALLAVDRVSITGAPSPIATTPRRSRRNTGSRSRSAAQICASGRDPNPASRRDRAALPGSGETRWLVWSARRQVRSEVIRFRPRLRQDRNSPQGYCAGRKPRCDTHVTPAQQCRGQTKAQAGMTLDPAAPPFNGKVVVQSLQIGSALDMCPC
jgi:hypothetical protein